MLISSRVTNNIYISIASYMDEELYATVDSLYRNASKPQNLYISILSQDTDHPDLQPIFDEFKIKNFSYDKINYKLSRGVGFARYITQQKLSLKYKYYLQIDSHTRFEKNWDTRLISDYERLQKVWGKFIFSSYPPAYEYVNDEVVLIQNGRVPPVVKIVNNDSFCKFEARYTDYFGGTQGQRTGYFCAGLAFGYTKYFLQVPYDPNIYFQGEEQTMSVRFFERAIDIVCPPDLYLYHDYVGLKRKRHWDTNKAQKDLQGPSSDRVELILDGFMQDRYSLLEGSYDLFTLMYIQ